MGRYFKRYIEKETGRKGERIFCKSDTITGKEMKLDKRRFVSTVYFNMLVVLTKMY